MTDRDGSPLTTLALALILVALVAVVMILVRGFRHDDERCTDTTPVVIGRTVTVVCTDWEPDQ